MAHTINEFWMPRLGGIERPATQPTLSGWSVERAPNPSFVEADLSLREGFNNVDSPIWFVAAPGAVGKSTLAREISARTGSVYLDLAKADTVAGNYITGGLVKNGLLAAWQANKSTILIDALDEARLRVTQKSFEDFFADVESQVRGRRIPMAIFGRVGIVEEAWVSLAERGLECPIFDIEFFDPPRAERFIMASLVRLADKAGNAGLAPRLQGHESVYRAAATKFVKGLQSVTALDGARFAGYAPVLEAVANVLAGITNPASLSDAVQETLQGQVLHDLTDRILTREAIKLREQLPAAIPNAIKEKVYGPEEQLLRLTATIYGVDVPLPKVELEPQYVAAYDAAVRAFMPQHPFLDGTGRQASGAVFGAVLNVHALFSASIQMVSAGEKHAGNGPFTPNPFLIDFYLASARLKQGQNPLVPPEHVVALYESVRARASAKDMLHLTIEGEEEEETADVEIEIATVGGQRQGTTISLRTSQAGVLRFGRQVNGVLVDAPQLEAVIGSGAPVELVAPVSMNVGRLSFDCSEIVVLRGDVTIDGEDPTVMLEARKLAESKLVGAPTVRKGVTFCVSWPGASAYPWVHYFVGVTSEENDDVHDALLRLRKLVVAFRSHSKGQLARIKGKIEHSRMTKGELGVALRRKLMRDRVLSLEGDMYVLNPKLLGSVVGATYQDLNLRRFNEKVRLYVSSLNGK